MPYYNKRLCKAEVGQSRQILIVRALLCCLPSYAASSQQALEQE